MYSESVPGLSVKFDSDGDNTAQSVVQTDSRLYGVQCSNINTEDAFIQFFDVASGSVTVGTTAPMFSLLVPAGDGTNRGGNDPLPTIPIEFNTAMTYACTTTPTGNGNPTTGLTVNILYAS